MQHRKISIIIAVVSLVAGAAVAQDAEPVLGTGVVTSITKPRDSESESYPIQIGDRIGWHWYIPDASEESCGTTYEQGEQYNRFLIDSARDEGTEVFIIWTPNEGENPAPLQVAGEAEIFAIGAGQGVANHVETCDTVTLLWEPLERDPARMGVTVRIFRDDESTGVFSYNTRRSKRWANKRRARAVFSGSLSGDVRLSSARSRPHTDHQIALEVRDVSHHQARGVGDPELGALPIVVSFDRRG